MTLILVEVDADGRLRWPGGERRCALGRGGVRVDKREGDGATPAGSFPFRRVYWRADRLERPRTRLPAEPIGRDLGWCDDPNDPAYNRPVRLPYPASHETMWRQDGLYDLVAVIGHNDAPPVPGMGSACFLHLARPDYAPTAGCVALDLPDLLGLLEAVGPGDLIRINPPA